jgi:sec-independent protein translocase protein TatA
MFGLGFPEMMALMILGVLLFGKNLPSVGRSLGKGLMEFKKGLQGVEDDVAGHLSRIDSTPESPRPPQRVAATAPKFSEPSEPV